MPAKIIKIEAPIVDAIAIVLNLGLIRRDDERKFSMAEIRSSLSVSRRKIKYQKISTQNREDIAKANAMLYTKTSKKGPKRPLILWGSIKYKIRAK